jgi:hypothetical protein
MVRLLTFTPSRSCNEPPLRRDAAARYINAGGIAQDQIKSRIGALNHRKFSHLRVERARNSTFLPSKIQGVAEVWMPFDAVSTVGCK